MPSLRLLVYLLIFNVFDTSFAEEAQTVWAQLGTDAKLKCPFSSKIHGDRPIIILWHKGSNSDTIYSYDARHTRLLSGTHWHDEDVLGTRVDLSVSATLAQLTLKHVRESDRGIYDCRVEYQYASSTVTKFNLSVIVPSDDPVILWKGQESYGTLGPITQGETVSLKCQASGGFPTPSITWLKEGQHMNSHQKTKYTRGTTVVSSEISFPAVRNIHMVSFVCQALPANPGHVISRPVTTTVRLNLTLPPTSVKISGINGPISAETTKTVECFAYGSSPAAQIELWKGDKRLSRVIRTVLDGGNITKATASIPISRADHRTNITCKAFNPVMQQSHNVAGALTDVISLDVNYEPEVKLQLGKEMNPSELVEGQTAHLECLVLANPPSHRIEWLKEGIAINQNSGIVLTGNSLTIPKMDKFHSGKYRCSAQNLEGKSLSNTIEINVKYTPICATSDTRTTGVALNNPAQIICRVDADPYKNLKFMWHRILPSGVRMPIDNASISYVENISYLSITPRSIEDYGIFSCMASNTLGQQIEPCLVEIVPAGPPEPLTNCTESASPTGTVTVNCEPGFDGGLSQQFHLEIWEDDELLHNITEEFASWEVITENKANMSFKLYSSNDKGESTPVRLQVGVFADAAGDKIKAEAKSSEEEGQINGIDTTIIFGSVAGFIFMLIFILLVGVAICCQKKRRKAKSSQQVARPECTGPDVISSIRRHPLSSNLDMLENARMAACLSSCDQMHERCHHSSSNSSLESNTQPTKNPHLHSMDFALNLCRPPPHKSYCKHCSHSLPHSSRQISASENQLAYPGAHSRSRCCRGRGCHILRDFEDVDSSSSSPNVRRHREVEAPLVEEESGDEEDEGVVVDSPSSNQLKCQARAASRGLYEALRQEGTRREVQQKVKNRATGLPYRERRENAGALIEDGRRHSIYNYKESAL